jgi:hypothetical protein
MTKFIRAMVLFFFAVSGAQAATVLIDFDEVTPEYNPGPTAVSISVVSKGFDFFASPTFSSGSETSVDSNGLYVDAECFAFGPGCDAYVTMEAVNSSAFSILSIGTLSTLSNQVLYGRITGGASADLSMAIGTGDWLNLEFFGVADSCQMFAPCGYHQVRLDDITVSAVPVPAAVWLFGSALAGLGWFRRRTA